MWHPLGREKLKLRCHSNDWQVALTTWRKSQKFRKVLATNTEQMSLRFWGIPHPKLGNFPSDFEEKLLTKHKPVLRKRQIYTMSLSVIVSGVRFNTYEYPGSFENLQEIHRNPISLSHICQRLSI